MFRTPLRFHFRRYVRAHARVCLASGELVAVLPLGLEYASVSTCDFPLTTRLLQVWIHKPLHTPLLCGREAELKIGRFGGSEQPALCEALKNTRKSIGILFAYHLYVSIINLSVKPVTGSCEISQILLCNGLRSINSTHVASNGQEALLLCVVDFYITSCVC